MMTIKDVLITDWTVAEIEVTVRERDSTRYIMEYHIGRDVKAGRSQRFVQETELGDLYSNGGDMKTLFINRIIQHRQLEKKAQGKEMCVGVLLENIPVELLNLTVESMRPYGCGNSDGMHGYRFECHVDAWNGIPGEYEQMALSDFG